MMFDPNFYISWELIATEHIIWSNGIDEIEFKGLEGVVEGGISTEWQAAKTSQLCCRRMINTALKLNQKKTETAPNSQTPFAHSIYGSELTIPPAVKLRVLEEHSLIVSCKVTILRWNQKLRFPICQVFSSVFEKKVVGAWYRHQLPPTLVYSFIICTT